MNNENPIIPSLGIIPENKDKNYYAVKEFVDSGSMDDAVRFTMNDKKFTDSITDGIMYSSKTNWSDSSQYNLKPNYSLPGTDSRENEYIIAEKERIIKQKDSYASRRADDAFGMKEGSGAFAIGTVYLNIPPMDINVEFVPNNHVFKVLRSSGETVASSGRSLTRIDLNIAFNGFDDINTNLRSLLAQFKTTPFLPVYSDYLQNIINPFNQQARTLEYLDTKKKQLKQLEEREAKLNDILYTSSKMSSLDNQIMKKINDIDDLGYINRDAYLVLTKFRDNLDNIPVSATHAEDWKNYNGRRVFDLEHYLRRNMSVSSDASYDSVQTERNLTEISGLRSEILSLSESAAAHTTESEGDRLREKQLVCVLSQISINTVPGSVETLGCRLSLFVFNYEPFSMDFSFISGYNPNDTTPDITKCDLFVDWYTRRWLVPREDGDKMSLGMYTGDDSMEFCYITKLDTEDTRDNPNNANVSTETFTVDSGMIVTSVSTSYTNMIQFLPVLSCKSPTCQYFGSLSSQITITIECTNHEKLNELSRMVELIGVMSRTRNRLNRCNFIRVSNEFLGLTGSRFFYINNYTIDTVPEYPGLTSVTLYLSEYIQGQEQFEILQREGTLSQRGLEVAAGWLLDRAKEFIIDGKKEFIKQFLVVEDKETGWFNYKSSIVSMFLSTSASYNQETLADINAQCGDLSVGKIFKKDISNVLDSLSKGTPLFKGVGEWIVSRSKKYTLTNAIVTRDPGMKKFSDKDYEEYSDKFSLSLLGFYDDFYDKNKPIISKVASLVKRNQLVEFIRNQTFPDMNNEIVNDPEIRAQDKLMNSGRKKKDEISTYPDLELPRYRDLPDGYRYLNTLKKVGSPLYDKDPNKPAQVLSNEVDPDFFMAKGSLWDSIDSDPLTSEGAKNALYHFKNIALTNRRYALKDAVNEQQLCNELIKKRRDDYDATYGKPGSSISQSMEKRISAGKIRLSKGNASSDSKTPGIEDGGEVINVILSDGSEAKLRIDHFSAPRDSRGEIPGNISDASSKYLYNMISDKDLYAEVSKTSTDVGGNHPVNLWYMDGGRKVLVHEKLLNANVGVQYVARANDAFDWSAHQAYLSGVNIFTRPLAISSKAPKKRGDMELASSPGSSLIGLDPASDQSENKNLWNKIGIVTNDPDTIKSKDIKPNVKKSTDNSGLRRFDRDADSHIELIASRIRDGQRDDTLRMSRAFPAFKVYFIEEDMPEWQRLDDEYSYRGVSSISIVKSRHEAADTAKIEFLNTRGTLDRSLFGLHDPNGDYAKRGNLESFDVSKQDTKEEQNIEEFVLKVGTVIKVKMGYCSDPNLMDTVFTGMIAEISGGNIIEVTAQGFGVELLHKAPKSSYYTSSAAAFKILFDLISTPDVIHFGKWEWFPADTETATKLYRKYRRQPETGELVGSSFWRRARGIDYILRLWNDTKNNNIWIPEESFIYKLFNGGWQTFVTQDKSIWDLFQEMTRRYPGYITAVLPFDNRATIYFGPSDFMYWYTDTNKEETKLWSAGYYNNMNIPDDDKVKQLLSDNKYKEISYSDIDAIMDKTALHLTKMINNNPSLRAKVKNLISHINSPKGYDRISFNYPHETAIDLISNWMGKTSKIDARAFCLTSAQSDLTATSSDNEIKNGLDFLASYIEIPEDHTINGDFLSFDDGNKNVVRLTYKNDSGESLYQSPDGKFFTKRQAIAVWDKMKRDNFSETNPSRKLVRQYHYKDSFHHIMANNIRTTSRDFYNKVTVESGIENTWSAGKLLFGTAGYSRVSAAIDDSIWQEKIREKRVQERNAHDIITTWHYALGNLWEEARKMYDGELIILGDASIKPHDIIMISDYFTDMFGPIEVEQVVHSFDYTTGFMTSIVPNLICYVNNSFQKGSLTVAGVYTDATSKMLQRLRGAGIIPSIGERFAKIGFMTTGFSSGRREPISFTPLMYSGRPFIAGVEGMVKDSFIEAANGFIRRKLYLFDQTLSAAAAARETIMLKYMNDQGTSRSPLFSGGNKPLINLGAKTK